MATKKERQRKLAREAHQRRLVRQAERAKRTRQLSVGAIAVILVAAVGVGIAAALGAFSSSTPLAKAAKAPASTPSATPTPSNPAAMVNGKCIYTTSGTASRKVSQPPATPDLTAKYTATVTTNRGNIVMDLFGSQAPCTVGSFVSLADQKYFNNTPCHRLTTKGIFVLQCGDPTGTGSGGPGYGFNSENLTSLKEVTVAGSKLAVYPAGIVAMANTGQPGSNGSQFFLVYKNTELGDNYTPFAQITSGLNIVQAVAQAGSDNSNGSGDGHPKEKVQIESVTISKA